MDQLGEAAHSLSTMGPACLPVAVELAPPALAVLKAGERPNCSEASQLPGSARVARSSYREQKQIKFDRIELANFGYIYVFPIIYIILNYNIQDIKYFSN